MASRQLGRDRELVPGARRRDPGAATDGAEVPASRISSSIRCGRGPSATAELSHSLCRGAHRHRDPGGRADATCQRSPDFAPALLVGRRTRRRPAHGNSREHRERLVRNVGVPVSRVPDAAGDELAGSSSRGRIFADRRRCAGRHTVRGARCLCLHRCTWPRRFHEQCCSRPGPFSPALRC